MDIWLIKKDTQFERDGKFSKGRTEVGVAETREAAIKKMHDDADFYITDTTMFEGCVVTKDTDYMMKLDVLRYCGNGMRITYNVYHRSTDEGVLFI